VKTLTRNRSLLVTLAVIAFSTGTAFQRITPAVPTVARPLPLSAVRLTGGPLAHAQQLDAKYLLALEPDSMLAYYRQRAGLEPKAQPYGGWDGDKRNLTGHIAGHYLSAVSLMWAATGDVRLKQRATTSSTSCRRFRTSRAMGTSAHSPEAGKHLPKFPRATSGLRRSI
jgi:hypothetical protein